MPPRFIIQQKITAFVNRYAIYGIAEHGEKGDFIALAQQKRMAFKEKVTFYSDEAKSSVAFTFRAEKVMDIHGRYFVEDANGQLIGAFKKDFTKSLLKSTWDILDASGQPTLTVTESSNILAFLRRFGGFLPFVGDAAQMIPYHFVFRDVQSGQEVGRYQKLTLFRDHYKLSMDDAAFARQDWRVLAALAVGLDALQSR